VPGTPPRLDFGDGLKIPLNKSAFLTLWENNNIWICYGVGRSTHSLQANGAAVRFAVGAMKLLLLTLAFAPERLEHVDNCGWRLKSRNPKDYVLGDIELPGKPVFPVTDANLGFGDSDSNSIPNAPGASLGNGGPGSQSSSATAQPGGSSFDMTGSFNKVDAFTAYIVKKKDVSLEYVRLHAQLV